MKLIITIIIIFNFSCKKKDEKIANSEFAKQTKSKISVETLPPVLPQFGLALKILEPDFYLVKNKGALNYLNASSFVDQDSDYIEAKLCDIKDSNCKETAENTYFSDNGSFQFYSLPSLSTTLHVRACTNPENSILDPDKIKEDYKYNCSDWFQANYYLKEPLNKLFKKQINSINKLSNEIIEECDKIRNSLRLYDKIKKDLQGDLKVMLANQLYHTNKVTCKEFFLSKKVQALINPKNKSMALAEDSSSEAGGVNNLTVVLAIGIPAVLLATGIVGLARYYLKKTVVNKTKEDNISKLNDKYKEIQSTIELEISRLKAEAEKLDKELQDKKQIATTLQSEINKYRTDYYENSTEVEELNKSLEKLQKTKGNLEGKISSMQAKDIEIAINKEKLSKLNKDLESKKLKIAEADQNIRGANTSIDETIKRRKNEKAKLFGEIKAIPMLSEIETNISTKKEELGKRKKYLSVLKTGLKKLQLQRENFEQIHDWQVEEGAITTQKTSIMERLIALDKYKKLLEVKSLQEKIAELKRPSSPQSIMERITSKSNNETKIKNATILLEEAIESLNIQGITDIDLELKKSFEDLKKKIQITTSQQGFDKNSTDSTIKRTKSELEALTPKHLAVVTKLDAAKVGNVDVKAEVLRITQTQDEYVKTWNSNYKKKKKLEGEIEALKNQTLVLNRQISQERARITMNQELTELDQFGKIMRLLDENKISLEQLQKGESALISQSEELEEKVRVLEQQKAKISSEFSLAQLNVNLQQIVQKIEQANLREIELYKKKNEALDNKKDRINKEKAVQIEIKTLQANVEESRQKQDTEKTNLNAQETTYQSDKSLQDQSASDDIQASKKSGIIAGGTTLLIGAAATAVGAYFSGQGLTETAESNLKIKIDNSVKKISAASKLLLEKSKELNIKIN